MAKTVTPTALLSDEAEHRYRYCLGLNEITAFKANGAREPSGLEGVIKRGYPSEAMDMVEAFCWC